MQSPPSDQDAGRIRTLLDLLTSEKLSGPIQTNTGPQPGPFAPSSRWTALKRRLRLQPLSWCGPATWRNGTPPLVVDHDEDDDMNEDENVVNDVVGEVAVEVEKERRGMNLAAALAAERELRSAEERNDRLCCVCMGRKKGAAMIPCGHTYCRVCSREVWRLRGSCPLCNRLILDILHIY